MTDHTKWYINDETMHTINTIAKIEDLNNRYHKNRKDELKTNVRAAKGTKADVEAISVYADVMRKMKMRY